MVGSLTKLKKEKKKWTTQIESDQGRKQNHSYPIDVHVPDDGAFQRHGVKGGKDVRVFEFS